MTGDQNIIANRFTGRTAVITGSTKGIGQAIAKRLAAEGAAVVITGRTVEAGERVTDEIIDTGGEAVFMQADMRVPEDIKRLIDDAVEQYGSLDILVNNAAVQTETTTSEATLEEWNLVVETNFRSYWLCAKHATEQMSDEGSIINISSNHASQTMPEIFPYNAVKAGINGMTRAMALDFGPNIRVNSISPGYIEVERNEEALSGYYRTQLERIHPVGRIGQPEDVAGVASFLASTDAAFITGANIPIDGGRGVVLQDDTVGEHNRDAE
jgi:glucose 1-dehydrogenase